MKKILIGLALLTTIGCNSNIKDVNIGDTVYFKQEATNLVGIGKVINRNKTTISLTDNHIILIYRLDDFDSMYGGKANHQKLEMKNTK